jgi:hypothetical protein
VCVEEGEDLVWRTVGVEHPGTAEIAELDWTFPFEVLLGWTAVAPLVDLLVVVESAWDLRVLVRTGLVVLGFLVAPAFAAPAGLGLQ